MASATDVTTSTMNLASAWEAIADHRGDALALHCGGVSRSWTEFEQRASRLAGAMAAVGIGAGHNVACALYNGNEYIEAEFAAFKLRAAPCNVNYRYVEAELEYLIDNSDSKAVFFDAALAELRRVAGTDENVMPATIALAKAGGTTGEWGTLMREVFGEFRAPTGVAGASGGTTGALSAVADRTRSMAGGPPRLLVAKPGLDGHSNGAEQIAVGARDAGMEVIYSGIRLTIDQIAASARDEDPDVIGVSILSGSHLELIPDLVARLRSEGVDAPVIVGGIIPEDDRPRLITAGVAAVYTPKDFELAKIMSDITDLTETSRA